MKYLVINNAPDGRHLRMFDGLVEANDYLTKKVGAGNNPGEPGCKTVYSDWGNRLVVEKRPDGWTVAKEQKFSAAYDALMCGVETKAQKRLLAAMGIE